MRKILLTILILSAYTVVSLGQGSITEGKWTYIVEGGGATIISSRATGEVTIPSEARSVGISDGFSMSQYRSASVRRAGSGGEVLLNADVLSTREE